MTHFRTTCSGVPGSVTTSPGHEERSTYTRSPFCSSEKFPEAFLHSALLSELAYVGVCFEIRNSLCRRSDHTLYKWQTDLRPEVSQLWPKKQIWFTACFSKKKFYWKTSKAIHLHSVYGWFQWQSRVVTKKTTSTTKLQVLLSDSTKADPCLRLITLRILIQASVR